MRTEVFSRIVVRVRTRSMYTLGCRKYVRYSSWSCIRQGPDSQGVSLRGGDDRWLPSAVQFPWGRYSAAGTARRRHPPVGQCRRGRSDCRPGPGCIAGHWRVEGPWGSGAEDRLENVALPCHRRTSPSRPWSALSTRLAQSNDADGSAWDKRRTESN